MAEEAVKLLVCYCWSPPWAITPVQIVHSRAHSGFWWLVGAGPVSAVPSEQQELLLQDPSALSALPGRWDWFRWRQRPSSLEKSWLCFTPLSFIRALVYVLLCFLSATTQIFCLLLDQDFFFTLTWTICKFNTFLSFFDLSASFPPVILC